jgi:hypothetical protein
MNMDEFRQYVERQRRQLDDQRIAPKNDERKLSDVERNQWNEQLHRTNQS